MAKKAKGKSTKLKTGKTPKIKIKKMYLSEPKKYKGNIGTGGSGEG